MKKNLEELVLKLQDFKNKKTILNEISQTYQETIHNLIIEHNAIKSFESNLNDLDREIVNIKDQLKIILAQNDGLSFSKVVEQYGIPLHSTTTCIVSAEKDIAIASTKNSTRVRNTTKVSRTSFLTEILIDLDLMDSDLIQIARASHQNTKEDNYYLIYIPLVNKTVLVSDFREQATYIVEGNYIEKNEVVDKASLQQNGIWIKFIDPIEGKNKLKNKLKNKGRDRWKEDVLYSLFPLDDKSLDDKCPEQIIVRNRGYVQLRHDIGTLFKDNETKTGAGREFLEGKSVKEAFERAFLSSDSYEHFADLWNRNDDKPFEISSTLKEMRSLFIHCKANESRQIIEHALRFKELVLYSLSLGRKLSLQEAQAYVKGLGDKTKSIIYDMFEDNETKTGAGREELLEGKSVKEAFEEAFSSSQRYKKFAQSRNMQGDKPHELPETFKQMWSLFIDCTPDQSRKFVTHGLQFKGLVLKSKELGKKLSLQEAEEYCNTFVEDRLQVQSDTRKLLWEMINDDTTHSIKGNDNTELFQGTFQGAFKDIETYKLFSERWNNDSTHAIKLPTTRIVFYSLYIGGGTKNERNNLPKSSSNMRSLIVSPDELASKKGNKRTLEEAQQQMKDSSKKKK